MSGEQIVGAVLLALLMSGLIGGTVFEVGWRTAAAIWTGSIAFTALTVFAVFLLVGGAS